MQSLKQKKAYWMFEKQISFIVMFVLSVLVFHGSIILADEGFLVRSRDYNSVDASLIENLLTDLEVVTKENYDKIETWQGTREFFNLRVYEGNRVNNRLQRANVNVSVAPKRLGIIAEGTTNFKVDSKRDMIWSHLSRNKGQTYKNMETMEIYGTFGLAFDTKIIARPDFIIRMEPSRFKKDGTIAANKALKFNTQDQEEVGRGLGAKEDSRDFFKLIGPTWQWLSSLQKLFSSDDLTFKAAKDTIVVEQSEGDDLKYYIRFGVLDKNGNIESFYEIILPLRTGFNPTLIRMLNAPEKTLSQQINVDYIDLEGVFLPSNVRIVDYGDDGNVVSDKKAIFKEQQINEAIPEETFSYKNLGLKNGDKFVDKIRNKEYIYQNDELILSSN